ncbi:unnamed protein product, partial [Choristocarpus tenellus]
MGEMETSLTCDGPIELPTDAIPSSGSSGKCGRRSSSAERRCRANRNQSRHGKRAEKRPLGCLDPTRESQGRHGRSEEQAIWWKIEKGEQRKRERPACRAPQKAKLEPHHGDSRLGYSLHPSLFGGNEEDKVGEQEGQGEERMGGKRSKCSGGIEEQGNNLGAERNEIDNSGRHCRLMKYDEFQDQESRLHSAEMGGSIWGGRDYPQDGE